MKNVPYLLVQLTESRTLFTSYISKPIIKTSFKKQLKYMKTFPNHLKRQKGKKKNDHCLRSHGPETMNMGGSITSRNGDPTGVKNTGESHGVENTVFVCPTSSSAITTTTSSSSISTSLIEKSTSGVDSTSSLSSLMVERNLDNP
ncbi:hypothetical protein Hanom_Chr14g01252311 [Helianthus anomalus]